MDLKDAEQLVNELLHKWHMVGGWPNGDWCFQWDNAKRRYGCCKYGSRVITLSRPMVGLNTVEQTTDTILHEIAHARVGRGYGHGITWQREAVFVGAKPKACYSAAVVNPVGDVVAFCALCGHRYTRYKMPAHYSQRVCAKHPCTNIPAKLRPVLQWQRSGSVATTSEALADAMVGCE